ncbi:MAG: ABC transporter substrate-binding protein [Theionarchaea archaeon]|nr:ABC transporter substrate-binding protein [Theionarchaea archaeon]
MRKIIFIAFILVLAFSFMVINGFQPVLAAEKSKYGGILKANHSKPAGIIGNPLEIRGWNHEFIDNTLQTLIRPSNTEMGVYEPLLATSWNLAPDKSNYTFKLRKGVKFHDGTPFNAKAAKWNLDMWVKSKRPRLDKVTSVDVIDDYTIRCNLKGWDAVTLADFAKDTFMISPTAWEKNGEKWIDYNPVGTGPFKLKEFKRNVHVKFEKFDDYWAEGLPYLDGIHFSQIPDPMTTIASLKRGEIDAWMGVDPVSARQLEGAKGLKVVPNPALHNVLQFNSVDPKSPWSDKRMREALEYALDKERLAKTIGRGYFTPVYNIIHSIPEGAGTTPRKYNPDKARQLIKDAGYENLRVKLYFSVGPDQDAAVAVQANLGAVGIQVDPTPVQGPAFHQKLFEPMVGSDLIFGNQRGARSDVLGPADETLASGSVFFQGVKRPPGFDDLLSKAMQQEDIKESLKYLWKMEKLAYDDAMFVPIYAIKLIIAQSSKVNDAIWFWSGQPYPNLERAWLSK